ncbi:hypothetical protein [Mangrovibacterium lignilyticum]|uniref:hypothetical protein n=1 Tax=Mangrovibacterium lignilyticum TaxID=2668052 RepID=UPI0013D45A50|nr:hypothetical protein [Mangrovibacterium lignilyticum]
MRQTIEWFDKHIIAWFGKERRFHYAQAFACAADGDPQAAGVLKEIAANDHYLPNIRSLTLQNFDSYFPDSLGGPVDNYLVNLAPSLRLAAMRSLEQPTHGNIARLLNALTNSLPPFSYYSLFVCLFVCLFVIH